MVRSVRTVLAIDRIGSSTQQMGSCVDFENDIAVGHRKLTIFLERGIFILLPVRRSSCFCGGLEQIPRHRRSNGHT